MCWIRVLLEKLERLTPCLRLCGDIPGGRSGVQESLRIDLIEEGKLSINIIPSDREKEPVKLVLILHDDAEENASPICSARCLEIKRFMKTFSLIQTSMAETKNIDSLSRQSSYLKSIT